MKPLPTMIRTCILSSLTCAVLLAQAPSKVANPSGGVGEAKTAPQAAPKNLGPMDAVPAGAPAFGPKAPGFPVDWSGPQPLSNPLFAQADGALWAVGSNYKMGFGADGAEFVPQLGHAAPQNFPVSFRLQAATAGGRALELGGRTEAVRDGQVVRYERGAIEEAYEARLDGVEQFFVLGQPVSGDLSLEVGVRTALATVQIGNELTFANEFGAVRYGSAFAIDANGNRLALETTRTAGGLRIDVPAAFLANAAWPVTVDPVISNLSVANSSYDFINPDVAYEGTAYRYAVVWERVYSAADHDILGKLLWDNGTAVTNGDIVMDISNVNFAKPKVASNRIAGQFLVVAERGATPNREVWGMTFDSGNPNVVNGPFRIDASTISGEAFGPDVGGDTNTQPPTYYCVTWERTYSATDHDIHARLVTTSGTTPSPTIFVSNSGSTLDSNPSISKSDGEGSAATQCWTVVWERDVGGEHDIYGYQLDWQGLVVHDVFPIITNGLDTTDAVVSPITDEAFGPRRYMVGFRVAASQIHEIGFALMQGTQFLSGTNALGSIENVTADDRRNPDIDCNGCTFTLIYEERYAGQNTDYDVYATTINVVGGTSFGLSEKRAGLATSTAMEAGAAYASVSTGAGSGVQGLAVYAFGTSPKVINAARYAAHSPNGGITTASTGCQGLGISVTGQPIIGEPIAFALTNAVGASVMAIGLPIPPVQICGSCYLGVDLYTSPLFIWAPSFAGIVPSEGSLVGLTLAVQGGDGNGVGCAFRVSDTLLVTIQ